MFPEIFKLGPFTLKSYGLFLTLGFASGIILAFFRAKKAGFKFDLILDLAILILFSSIIGSRFFYVIYHLNEFSGHWTDVFNPFQSSGEIGIYGLSMMGGVVLAIVSGIVFLIFKKVSVLKIADLFSPSFMLGLGFARIGCFLNGCCFGKPTNSFLGVVFPEDCFAGYIYPHTPIYPTQLFSALKGFLIFGLILWLEKYKKFDGFTFGLMLIFFPLGRFIIDFFRYYEESMIFAKIGGISFSVNQALSVLIFLIGFILWNFWRIRGKKKERVPFSQ
jgi:phosphatidylglycerol:prolipoprotein diacylglycerol transferase